MKRIFYFLAAAIMTAAINSCSKTEVEEPVNTPPNGGGAESSLVSLSGEEGDIVLVAGQNTDKTITVQLDKAPENNVSVTLGVESEYPDAKLMNETVTLSKSNLSQKVTLTVAPQKGEAGKSYTVKAVIKEVTGAKKGEQAEVSYKITGDTSEETVDKGTKPITPHKTPVFTADNRFSVDFTTPMETKDGFSIEFWVKFNDNTDANLKDNWWGVSNLENRKKVLSPTNDNINANFLTFKTENGDIYYYMYPNGKLNKREGKEDGYGPEMQINGGIITYAFASYNDTFGVDTWYHVAITGANGKLTMYVNGKPDFTSDATIASGKITGIKIPDGWNKVNNDPQYELAHMRLWSKALSQEEVSENMGNEIAGYEGLFAYWKFNDNGNTIKEYCKGYDITATGLNWSAEDTDFANMVKE